MGFAGIAVDVGYLEYRQQAQQTATDAAAVGGARSAAARGLPELAPRPAAPLSRRGEQRLSQRR